MLGHPFFKVTIVDETIWWQMKMSQKGILNLDYKADLW